MTVSIEESALDHYKGVFMEYDNVTGVGTGLKRTGGQILRPRQYCIVIYVQTKKLPADLGEFELIPPSVEYNGHHVLTDIVETGPIAGALAN